MQLGGFLVPGTSKEGTGGGNKNQARDRNESDFVCVCLLLCLQSLAGVAGLALSKDFLY